MHPEDEKRFKIEGIGRLLNHQELSLFLVLFLTLIPVLSSCNHKELHYEANSQFRLLMVAFDWSQLSGHEKPEGMRVIFFPKMERVNRGYSISRMVRADR